MKNDKSWALRFLAFDVSCDPQGNVGLDAMAGVSAAHWPALCAEVNAVLDWLNTHHGTRQGALEDGGCWDMTLTGSLERSQPLVLVFDAAAAQMQVQPQPGEVLRYSLNLSLSLADWLAQDFCEHFCIYQG